MITIELEDTAVIAALERLAARASEAGLRPALQAIGEALAQTTKVRFDKGIAPDGRAWRKNTPATLRAKLRAGRGERPLVATGQLAHTIRYQLVRGGVAVGTDRFGALFRAGAAVHQMGDRRGRIPARPFLGLSNADRPVILAIIARHLAG